VATGDWDPVLARDEYLALERKLPADTDQRTRAVAALRAEVLQSLAGLEDVQKAVRRDREFRARVLAICAHWKQAERGPGNRFNLWDDVVEFCFFALGRNYPASTLKKWVRAVEQGSGGETAPLTPEPEVTSTEPPDAPPVPLVAAEAPPVPPVCPTPPRRRWLGWRDAAYIGAFGLALAVALAGRRGSSPPVAVARADEDSFRATAESLHQLAKAMWTELAVDGRRVADDDPCRKYEGTWALDGSYVLDYDDAASRANPLLSKARDGAFYARCHPGEGGRPAQLIGVDITTLDVYERGHEAFDERVAETVNVVRAVITFAADAPAKREVRTIERVRTAAFPRQGHERDHQLLLRHLDAVDHFARGTCDPDGKPSASAMAFHCKSTGQWFKYTKAFRKSPL
jgi:hypothetical protein